MSTASAAILISSGEPAGIGPDICIDLAAGNLAGRPVFVGNADLFAQRAEAMRRSIAIDLVDSVGAALVHAPGKMQVLDVPLGAPVEIGRLDTANAPYVLALLECGADLCASGAAAALVTAPVQKSIINEAGIQFSGHTEYLAELTGADTPVMMLACDALRVALATTHLPLADVPRRIDADRLTRVIEVLHADLAARFEIPQPRIRVLGLNPHAGERGVLGHEEIEVIGPTLERLRAKGLTLLGPSPADTAFTADALAESDAVLAMYHDQGLPVIKALGFGNVVNVTLGLPIIRTSVDHGTALELAGSGRARAGSLAAAYALAGRLAGSTAS